MKYLCKECVDGMDVAAPPPATGLTGWQAAGDGRCSATLELVRERDRWWSMSRCGRGEVPEAAGAQDWTGPDWTGVPGRVNLGR